MSTETVALVVGVFVGFPALISAITVAIVQLVTLKRGQTKQTNAIQKVEILVNSRMTDITNRVTQLEDALRSAGITVPTDPASSTHQSGDDE